MKKIILSLFVSIIWFICFSNAWTLTSCSLWNYEWEDISEWYCSPSSVSVSSLSPDEDWYIQVLNSNWFNNLVNYCDSVWYWVNSCSYEIWFLNCLWEYDYWEWMVPCEPVDYLTCDYNMDDETSYSCDSLYLDLNNYWDTVYYKVYNSYFSFCADEECAEDMYPSTTTSVTLSYVPSEPDEPDEPDEPWTWWNENPPVIPDNPWEWWNWWNIVPDWSLVAVITWVFSVFWELIPYVVYIWIWILIVTVWFYAIRRLVNWLSDKIHNNFKF